MRNLLRLAFFLTLLLIGPNMIRLAQGQPQSSRRPQTNSELDFTILQSVRRFRRYNKITASPLPAPHPVLSVAWSPVPHTARSPLTPMVGR
jgi:hypothetical protein